MFKQQTLCVALTLSTPFPRAGVFSYLSVEKVMQVALLVLSTKHIDDFTILWRAGGTLRFTFCIAFKAVLMEGVAAQEVDRRKLQGAGAHAALGLLKYLGTVWRSRQGSQTSAGVVRSTDTCNISGKRITWFSAPGSRSGHEQFPPDTV